MDAKAEILRSVKKDLEVLEELIKESAETMRNEELTQYPIFVLSKPSFPAGTLLAKQDEAQTHFSLYATTTEDFIRMGLITMDKAKKFVATYKPVDKYMCLFIVPENPQEAHFIFQPYGV